MTSPTPDSSPTTNAEAGTTPPTSTNTDPYRLDFRVRGGLVMATVTEADGTRIEIHDYVTWLRVRSDLGRAMLVLGHHNGDLQGRPVGLFEVTLRSDELTALRELVEGTKWSELPRPTGGDVTASNLEIDYARGSLLIRREFNAANREFIAALGPLIDRLTETCGAMLAAPANALSVVVSATPDAGSGGPGLVQFSYELHNVGTGPIAIVDPRVPGADGQPRGRFMLTTVTQDPRPVMWTPVTLPALPDDQPKLLTLPAGGKLAIPMAWQMAQSGSYYLRGDWIDYAGQSPTAEHAKVMPLPDDLAQAHAPHGPYAVRGAAFSNAVPFTIAPG